MLDLTVEIEGKTEGDLLMALEEVVKQIENHGFTSGFDSNESGRYNFTINGDPEEEPNE